MSVILQDLTQASREDLIAQIEAMRKQQSSRIVAKISPKGAVSIYGLGRFPVTLYASQLARLLGERDNLLSFMKAHVGELATRE
jgi:hypothetical protein